MSADPPRSAEAAPVPPAEAPVNRLGDDPLAARLRGFGPLGILVIVAILAGNLVLARGGIGIEQR